MLMPISLSVSHISTRYRGLCPAYLHAGAKIAAQLLSRPRAARCESRSCCCELRALSALLPLSVSCSPCGAHRSVPLAAHRQSRQIVCDMPSPGAKQPLMLNSSGCALAATYDSSTPQRILLRDRSQRREVLGSRRPQMLRV